MPPTIRLATIDDVPILVEHNLRLAQESEDKQLDEAVLTAGIRAALADPHKGPYFLAEVEGRVVGQLQITSEFSDWRNGWVWRIQGDYVRAEARGPGVFRALSEPRLALADRHPRGLALPRDR